MHVNAIDAAEYAHGAQYARRFGNIAYLTFTANGGSYSLGLRYVSWLGT